jgi:hypothetical protein
MTNPTKRLALAVTSLPLLFCFAACGDSAEAREVREKVGETVDATKDLAVKTWADLKRESQPMLDGARQQLDELQKDIAAGGSKVSEQAKQAAAAAKREIDDAAKAVESVKDAGSESAQKAWQSFNEALGHAKTSLQQGWEELRK